VIDGAVYVTLV